MSFDELIATTRDHLQREGRVAYRVLKRRFELTDDDIEDIKADLIDAKRVARDEDGRVLVWVGEGETPATRFPNGESGALADRADRRLITVMFCDIVGSTELSSRFDAEELREVVRHYQTICAQVISEHDGHIAQYLGDGLLVYFGYPVALEYEASLAVQAALGILAALGKDMLLTTRLGAPLEVRIGVHTGPVVIGAMGNEHKAEHLALGETPNIAARVQSAARPNEILITADTFRLVEGLYDCVKLGPHVLKGVSRTVALYAVRGDGPVLNRFEVALSTGLLTHFVGRDTELSLLEQHWRLACGGRGQMVLLKGDPGIGKSRLAQEFKHATGDAPRHITLRCSPNHQQSAFYPLVQLLNRLFAFDADDDDATQLDKIARTLARYAFPHADTALLFGSLLGIAHPEVEKFEVQEPPQRKRGLFAALTAWLLEEASNQPVFMIFDDVHWMDPATHEWLAYYMDHIPTSHTMALLAFRSGYAAPWERRSYLHNLTLGRLGDSEIASIIRDVAESDAVPPAVINAICERADGIPLYAEELAKSMADVGLFDSASNGGVDATAIQAIAIPASLQDSLEARIDRCPTGKNVAQWGAVIGREFSDAILKHLIPETALLRRGIDELLDAELIYRSGTPDHPAYIFKHALVRDTAYESLLNRQRRSRHAEIARIIDTHFEELAQREPEVLAYHFLEGGDQYRAVEKLYEAGEQAIDRSATTVAIAHLKRALELAPQVPDDPERLALQIRIHILLGPLLAAARGAGTAEVKELYSNALALCEKADDKRSRFTVYFGLRRHYLANSDLKSAHNIGYALYKAASASGERDYLIEAHVALSTSYYFRGDLLSAQNHVEQALALYDPALHSRHTLAYGIDPGATCQIRGAAIAWQRGDPARAEQMTHEALELSARIGHPASRVFVLTEAAGIDVTRAELEGVLTHASLAHELAVEHEFAFYQGWNEIYRGWALVGKSEADDGLKEMQHGFTMLEQATSADDVRRVIGYSHFLSLLAEAHGLAGDPEQGLALLPEAIAHIERTGARGSESMLYRIRGELLAQMRLSSEAERSLFKARQLAETQQAWSVELRAALSLARLYQSTNRPNDVAGLLRTCVDRFDDEKTTRDLVCARELLADLSA